MSAQRSGQGHMHSSFFTVDGVGLALKGGGDSIDPHQGAGQFGEENSDHQQHWSVKDLDLKQRMVIGQPGFLASWYSSSSCCSWESTKL